MLESFQYRNDKPISQLVKQMNEPVDVTQMNKLSYKSIKQTLMEEGYLVEQYDATMEKNVTLPTEKGKGIGIYLENRVSSNGKPYNVIMYSEKAQLFLKDNLEQLLMNID